MGPKGFPGTAMGLSTRVEWRTRRESTRIGGPGNRRTQRACGVGLASGERSTSRRPILDDSCRVPPSILDDEPGLCLESPSVPSGPAARIRPRAGRVGSPTGPPITYQRNCVAERLTDRVERRPYRAGPSRGRDCGRRGPTRLTCHNRPIPPVPPFAPCATCTRGGHWCHFGLVGRDVPSRRRMAGQWMSDFTSE